MAKSPKKSKSKEDIRAYRSKVSLLKKAGVVSKKVDARRQKITRYMMDKIKSFAWIFDKSTYVKVRTKSKDTAERVSKETPGTKSAGKNVYVMTGPRTKKYTPEVNNYTVIKGKLAYRHSNGRVYYRLKPGLTVRPKGYKWVLLPDYRSPSEYESYRDLQNYLDEDSRAKKMSDYALHNVYLVKSEDAEPFDPDDYGWFGAEDDEAFAEAVARWKDSDEYRKAMKDY